MNHAPPSLLRRLGGGFPLAAGFRQKACAQGAFFGQSFISTVAVVANGRAGDQRGRFVLTVGKGFALVPSSLYAAGADRGSFPSRPPADNLLSLQLTDRALPAHLFGL